MKKLSYTRRGFLKTVGVGAAALALPMGLFTAETDVDRPNILWILSEDISPDLVGIRS